MINVLEHPAYIEGVRKAQEARAANKVLSAKRLEDFTWFHRYADRHAAAVAKRRAEARLSKYGC